MKFHSNHTILFIFSMLFMLSLTAAGQISNSVEPVYIHKDGAWFLSDKGREFKVKIDTLTLRFASTIPEARITEILKSLNLEEIRRSKLGFIDVRVRSDELSFRVAAMIEKDPRIVEAFPATFGEYLTDDPSFSSQWNLHNTGAGGGTPDADIDAPEAWALATGDPAIIVAPLDSGIDYNHNDLGPNIWQNLGEDADGDGKTLVFSGGKWIFDSGDVNNFDDDGNGMKDDFIGWDPEHNNNDVMDIMGHGTHVSGIVAARSNNATNVAGVAGGWDGKPGVSIMQVQVGDWYPNSDILDDAIIYAVDNGARVITMSLSVYETSDINSALDYADSQGVFVDCAAGNNYGGGVSYHAYHSKVVAVSATDRHDAFAYFSSKGPEVEICAPGDDVTSTIPGQSQGSMSGTSMSSPHIAGAAGLLLSVAPWMDHKDLLQVLTSTADDLGPAGWDSSYGWGRLNLFNAVTAVIDLQMLKPDTFFISATTGGTVNFSLDAGVENAGRTYLLLATLSGTEPGTPVGSTLVPLNFDAVTDLSILFANTTILTNSLGSLDGAGLSAASFNPAPEELREAVDMTLHFAYILGNPIDTASNPVPLFVLD
ncbi:MAG: S8 family serine peptidase [Planctomycetota bacterium]|jgi:subtilisin family serine protease